MLCKHGDYNGGYEFEISDLVHVADKHNTEYTVCGVKRTELNSDNFVAVSLKSATDMRHAALCTMCVGKFVDEVLNFFDATNAIFNKK